MTLIASKLEKEEKILQRAFLYVSFWIYRCLRYHYCCDSRPFSETVWPILPKRVVDVSQLAKGCINLVDGSSIRAPYCALSYRWQGNAVRTTEVSLAAFKREIPISLLQSQITDAFLIANRLGIRYVWVDALVSCPCTTYHSKICSFQ